MFCFIKKSRKCKEIYGKTERDAKQTAIRKSHFKLPGEQNKNKLITCVSGTCCTADRS